MSIKTKLKNWLDIKEPEDLKEIQKLKKDIAAEISKAMRDLDYWHRTFRSFSVIPCAYCKKQMRVYPYGGAYYHIKDNQKVHAECYDKFLRQTGGKK